MVDARASDDFSFLPLSLSCFFLPQFVAFPRRVLDPLLTLPGGAFSRSALPRGQFVGIGLGQFFERLDLLLGLFQQFLERPPVRNELLPASARTLMPSCATRSMVTRPSSMSVATICVSSSSHFSPP